MKRQILLVLLSFITLPFFGQSKFSLDLRIGSINYQQKIVCYDLYIINVGDSDFNLAGQNYRLFYNSALISYIPDSAVSLLPLGPYTPFTLVNYSEDNNAMGVGSLPFETDFGFLNFFIDLNNTQLGGVNIMRDSSLKVVELCFQVQDLNVDLSCFDIYFADEETTGAYASAFNELSVWIGPNMTATAIADTFQNIYSDSLSQCIDFIENTKAVCNDGLDNDGDGDFDCDDQDCAKPFFISIDSKQPTVSSCPSLNDGAISITAINTTSYSMDGGINFQNSGLFEGLSPGIFMIRLLNDATGCVKDTLIQLVAPLCIEICNDGKDNDGDGDVDCDDQDCNMPIINSIVIQNPTQVSCPDLDNGSISVTASNTTFYSLDNGNSYQFSGLFQGLREGQYPIRLLNDTTGCTFDTIIKLTAPPCNEICNDGIDNDGDGAIDCVDQDCGLPFINAIKFQNPTLSSCPNLDNGTINISANNATFYSIDGGISYNSAGIFNGLQAGIYIVQMLNDVTGCIKDTSVILVAPLCTEICIDGLDNDGDGDIDCYDIDCSKPIINDIIVQNPTLSSCPNLDNGSIFIAATNVSQYSLDAGANYQISGMFEGLMEDDYYIQMINDSTGCALDSLIQLVSPFCEEICSDDIDNDGDGQIDCLDQDCLCLDDEFIYPNVIYLMSSNGNDKFYFYMNQFKVKRVLSWQVYDRWGNLVYENKDFFEGGKSEEWNGTYLGNDLSNGVYIVKINYLPVGNSEFIVNKLITLTIL